MITQEKQPARLRWVLLLASLAIVLSVTATTLETAAGSAEGPSVVLSPTTALPNQTITVTGSGFTKSDGVTVNSITVGGAPITREKISGGSVVAVDSTGSFFATLVLPVLSPTLLPGSHSVAVKDSQGKQAAVTLTIPEPTLSLSPASGRSGSTVTVTGANYPVASTRTGADGTAKVYIEYLVEGGTPSRVATATPDSAGNISTSFRIPRNAPVGSTDNVVTATVAGTSIFGTTEHSLPAATLTVSPASVAPDTVATLSGSNFKPFAPVASLAIENLRLSLLNNTYTDADGSFTGTFEVPLLENGPYAITVGVGDEQYVVGFTVTGAVLPVAEPPSLAPETPHSVDLGRALGPLGDNLVRVFHFDNTTKRWGYHDPRPAFADLNNVSRLVEGQAYWIAVKADQNALMNGRIRAFFQGWNLIGW